MDVLNRGILLPTPKIDYIAVLMRFISLGIIAFFTVFVARTASAQYFEGAIGSTTWIGVEGGLSLASETFDSVPQNSIPNLKTFGIFGIHAEHWFSNHFGVGLAVLYDGKGVEEDYSAAASNRDTFGTIYSGSDNFSMSYLEIPIILKYSLGNGTVRPYLFAGPSFGFLLSASESASGQLASVSNIKSFLKSSDLSIYGGIGLMDEIERGPIISLEIGFASGVKDLFQSVPLRVTTDGHPFPEPIDVTGAKSNDFRILLGAEWPI